MRMKKTTVALSACAAALLSAAGTQAAVTISSATTTNMTCLGGVCAPTAKNAVLNVGDLETLLASGSVTVTTTGTGVEAGDINVKSALSWSSTGALSLLANKSVAVDSPINVAGLSGLSIQTGGKTGTFSFGKTGNVTFANLSSVLSINGATYTLVGDLKTLASDIAANPGGDFALAANYDASQGGSYAVTTTSNGIFEGLGNVISNLVPGSYRGDRPEAVANVGLFEELGATGIVKDIGLTNVSISVVKQKGVHELLYVGPLVGTNYGTVLSSYAMGTITDKLGAYDGGLVSQNYGMIVNSHAAVEIATSAKKIEAGDSGGLVCINFGTISTSYATGGVSEVRAGGLVSYNFNNGIITGSYATGSVHVSNVVGQASAGGGLVGINDGAIGDSYATGNVQTGNILADSYADVGGLVGANGNTINFSYSTGVVTGGTGSTVGGLIGDDGSQPGSLTDDYWDTDTSGQNQGAGNIANDPGITGLTTAQLQSGLPQGFDPKIWGEKSNIDDGFPYLLANKPGK